MLLHMHIAGPIN